MGSIIGYQADESSIPVNKVNIKHETVILALEKMILQDSFFSVCVIDKCASMYNLIIPSDNQKIYNTLHCINWNEMNAAYRNSIITMILNDFKQVLNINTIEDIKL